MANAKITFQLEVTFDSYSVQNQLEGYNWRWLVGWFGLVFNYKLYLPLSESVIFILKLCLQITRCWEEVVVITLKW